MHFFIDTKTFTKYVTLAADIAIKNATKGHCCADMINISAYSNVLQLEAYGGTASITVEVKQSDGYEHDTSGNACIQAKELMSALKSFPPSEELEVCIKDSKLKLSPVSDIYDYFKIQIYPNHAMPLSPENYDQELTVNREYFVKGLQQAAYLPAINEKLFSYMCVLFESTDNTLKFTAGSGFRFAIIEYAGNDKVISSADTKILFPKTNVSNITRVFKKATCPTLDIKISSGDPTNNIPEQQVIASDNITVRIYEAEAFTKYPNLNGFTDHNYTYQVPTKVQDWKYVAEAITASKHSLTENIHNVKVMADLLDGHFDIQANTLMNINRKVPFDPELCATDDSQEKSCKPWFCCDANHIIEMFKKNKKKETVTIVFGPVFAF